MSLNEETQNQNAGSPSPSQEPANKPYIARLKKTGKAIGCLLRKCWSKGRAYPSTKRWESTDTLEYIFDVLAEVRVPIVLGVLFVFLHKPIEEFAVKRLVAPILAHFDTRWPSSLIALGLALILFLRFSQLVRRRYIVEGKVVLSAFFILLGYGYYRLGRPDFEFYGLFDKACTIAFVDLIPPACLAPLALRLWTCYSKCRAGQEGQAPESVEGFLTDQPLTEEEEELSGWTIQAQALTQKLLATDTTHAAFSLGIVASWGEGKSSFMGIMQRYLQQAYREVIIMRFNPWLYDKEAQLTKVFFEELRRTLAPYSSKLSKSIDNYTDLLLAVDSGWLKLALEVLQQSQSNTTKQFDKLSHEIQKLGRKVVIFIDDVDRLTREELMELFNLVRNSSNLPCLYFVLAYDKSYVLKTLQSDGEHMSRYPEKIFQEEYPLPKLTPDTMWTVLEECLSETQFGKKDKDKKQGAEDDQAEDKENKVSTLLRELKKEGVNLPYHLTTIRMVKRMVNAFNSQYELLHEVGVAPFDLFIFELIYYVYPSVYDFLLEMHKEALASLNASPGEYSPSSTNSSSSFFFSHINGEGMQYISLHPEGEKPNGMAPDGDKNEGQTSSEPSNEASGNTYPIVDTLKELALGLEDRYKKEILVRRIAELLGLLWSKDRKPALGQINHMAYWRRYFYRSLLKGNLSQEELAAFLREPNQENREKCLKGWDQVMPLAFIEVVLNYVPKSQAEMETIVRSMFDWNALPENGMPFHCSVIDGVIEKGSIPREEKEAMLSRILKDKAAIRPAFEYTVERLHSEGEEATILPEDVVLKIQSRIFEKVVEEASKEESPIKWLYATYWLRCGSNNGSRVTRPSTVDECMCAIIRDKGVDGFLGYILTRAGIKVYFLHDIPWDTLEEFDKFLREQPSTMYIDNFLDFLEIALKQEKERPQEGSIYSIEPGEWKPYIAPKFAFDIFGKHSDYLFSTHQEGKQD
nr:P-loop NTPase fold protein [uncultured Porphyromonas sp.]